VRASVLMSSVLARPGTLEQDVSAREERQHEFVDHPPLPDDGLADLHVPTLAQGAEPLQALEVVAHAGPPFSSGMFSIDERQACVGRHFLVAGTVRS
jgi:hypothetical protein